jgi:hypothetical protein
LRALSDDLQKGSRIDAEKHADDHNRYKAEAAYAADFYAAGNRHSSAVFNIVALPFASPAHCNLLVFWFQISRHFLLLQHNQHS